jgi:hypothetical protein
MLSKLPETGGPERISTEGWQHVAWTDGTLAGYPIRVRWDHVQRELAATQTTAAAERRGFNARRRERGWRAAST